MISLIVAMGSAAFAQELIPDGGVVHSWETDGINGWHTLYKTRQAYIGDKVLRFKPNNAYRYTPLALLTQVVEEAGIYDLCACMKTAIPKAPPGKEWSLSLQAWNLNAKKIARDEFGVRVDLGRGIMHGKKDWQCFCQGMNVGQAGVLCQLRAYAHNGEEWPPYARAYIGFLSLIKRQP